MKKVLLLAMLFLTGAPLADACQPMNKKPALTFRQDGEDLIVSTTITINGSGHVLVPNYRNGNGEIVLKYTVIQNVDQAVRCLKQVPIDWRIKGHTKGAETYRVEEQLLALHTDELKQLAEQLASLTGKQPGAARVAFWW